MSIEQVENNIDKTPIYNNFLSDTKSVIKPITSSNVPYSSYSGRFFMVIQNYTNISGEEEAIFKPELTGLIGDGNTFRRRTFNIAVTEDTIKEVMQNGFYDKDFFPHIGEFAGHLRLVDKGEQGYEIVSNKHKLSPQLSQLHPKDVLAAISSGKSLMIYRSSYGPLTYQYITPPTKGFNEKYIESIRKSLTVAPVPEIIIASPQEGAVLSGPSSGVTLQITGEALDNTWDEESGDNIPIIRVDVKVGPNEYKQATLNPRTSSSLYRTWSFLDTITISGPLEVIARAQYDRGSDSEPLSRLAKINIIIYFQPGLPLPNIIGPCLLLIESYRLSSFVGRYGIGRTIKTFSLLPGEKTKISTRSYTKTEETAKYASSILDSATQESIDDFETSIATEQTDKRVFHEVSSYEANGELGGVLKGIGIKLGGGIKRNTDFTHEEFAKTIAEVTRKHSDKASAKREVQINTSYEKNVITETEVSVEREIQNINVSRTLNFVFRQMAQEFIAVLHLIDIRVAFWDGKSDHVQSIKEEVPLPELHSLIEKYILPDMKEKVKNAIIDQITSILDYEGIPVEDFVIKRELEAEPGTPPERSSYYHVNRKKTSKYIDPTREYHIEVPGIILSVDKYIMNTDGINVDAELGNGDALDTYSEGLQIEAINSKRLENKLREIEITINQLAVDLVADNRDKGVNLFRKAFPCCKPNIFSLWPPKQDNKEDNKKDNVLMGNTE